MNQSVSQTMQNRSRAVPPWRFVYFIAAEQIGMVKIGVADHPEKRRRMLQIGSPAPLSIIGVMETDDAPSLERELHRRFSHLRAHGEWFRLDPSILDYIRERTPDLPEGCGIAFLRRKPEAEPVALSFKRADGESERKFIQRMCDGARAAGFVVER